MQTSVKPKPQAPKAPAAMPRVGRTASPTQIAQASQARRAQPAAPVRPQPQATAGSVTSSPPGSPTGLAAIAGLPPNVQQALADMRGEATRQVDALHMRSVAAGDQQWAPDKTERLIMELIQGGGRNAGQMENDVERRLGRQLGGGQPPVGGTPGIPFGARPGAGGGAQMPGRNTPTLDQDPAWNAYLAQFESDRAGLEADAARDRDAIGRRLGFMLPQFDWGAEGARRDLSLGMEDRGILRSGQHEQALAEMVRDQSMQRGALQMDARDQQAGIEGNLARALREMEAERQRQMIAAAQRMALDSGMAPYRV